MTLDEYEAMQRSKAASEWPDICLGYQAFPSGGLTAVVAAKVPQHQLPVWLDVCILISGPDTVSAQRISCRQHKGF